MIQIQNLAAPLGRFLIAIIFLMSGINKIFGYSGTAQYMESVGVPSILLPVAIVVEILAALMVILGYQARWGALALAGFSALTAVIFHGDFGDQNQMIHFMKNFAIAGGMLMIVANGAGAYAMDNRRG